MSFPPTTAVSVERAQFYFTKEQMKPDLIYIKCNFKILVDGIKKLETCVYL
jgi:hypothetical protein